MQKMHLSENQFHHSFKMHVFSGYIWGGLKTEIPGLESTLNTEISQSNRISHFAPLSPPLPSPSLLSLPCHMTKLKQFSKDCDAFIQGKIIQGSGEHSALQTVGHCPQRFGAGASFIEHWKRPHGIHMTG